MGVTFNLMTESVAVVRGGAHSHYRLEYYLECHKSALHDEEDAKVQIKDASIDRLQIV